MSAFLTARQLVWSGWVVGALLMLGWLPPVAYGIVVPASALLVALIPGSRPDIDRRVDRADLAVIAAIYAVVVALYRLAFGYFTVDSVAGLFLCFGGGMIIGVAGPVVYTRIRGRSLRSLGFRLDNWRQALATGAVFAGVQVALTLFGYSFPAPERWVPLLVLALTVGLFEAVFFRGFVQTRLEASFGSVIGVGGAAALYGLYHVGYGMGGAEMVFLTGLGLVYAIAFAITGNLLAIWPLLTPIGGFFATMSSGDITLPWMAILGFLDVLGIMAAVLWIVHRRERKALAMEAERSTPPLVSPS